MYLSVGNNPLTWGVGFLEYPIDSTLRMLVCTGRFSAVGAGGPLKKLDGGGAAGPRPRLEARVCLVIKEPTSPKKQMRWPQGSRVSLMR